jgi:hypothetical protein
MPFLEHADEKHFSEGAFINRFMITDGKGLVWVVQINLFRRFISGVNGADRAMTDNSSFSFLMLAPASFG